MFFNLRAYQGAAMLPLLLFYQHLLQYEEEEGGQCPPMYSFPQCLLQQEEDWGCRDGPHCVFAHLFQPCTVLQETMKRCNWYQCTCDFALAGACHQSYQQQMLKSQNAFPSTVSQWRQQSNLQTRQFVLTICLSFCRAKISSAPTHKMRN